MEITAGENRRSTVQFVDSNKLKTIMSWSDATLRTFLDMGLPHFKPGRKIYYSVTEVRDWMNNFARGQRAK